jgi:hypothetical protein
MSSSLTDAAAKLTPEQRRLIAKCLLNAYAELAIVDTVLCETEFKHVTTPSSEIYRIYKSFRD